MRKSTSSIALFCLSVTSPQERVAAPFGTDRGHVAMAGQIVTASPNGSRRSTMA
jgi:hypothetical protein